MRIGEVADAAGVTPKTIRYYESIGLLAPPPRTPSGYRDYGSEVIDRLRFIRDSQVSGLTLAEIHSVLDLKDSGERTCDHTLALLRRHISDIDTQIERLTVARAELDTYARRAERLDPAECIDPNRCQVIDGAGTPGPSAPGRFGEQRRSS